ncbi:MAG: PQQ-binding-like beta-propeller repeat protein [Bacteroidales bacterium]|nr:PQQ-binding-like beta-propeller repeat protein [Bacteroidales bacterium]
MKNLLLFLFVTSACLFAIAQEDMPTVWETKLGHKIIYHGTDLADNSDSYSFAASEKEITIFKNADGKPIWTKPFKELAPKLRKIDELIPFWESNIVFLFDRKTGKDQIACVDMETGKLLWNTDKYQNVTKDVVIYIPEEEAFAISLKKELVFIKAHTGEEVWSTVKFKGVVGKYVYNADHRTMVMVNFVPGGLAAFFTGFKNQIAKINLKNGEILWEATYIGRAERKIWTKEFVYDLDVKDDKVHLRLNGIQVYDYNTGASLWSAAFDFTPGGVAKGPSGTKKMGVYRAVADPVIVGDDIYVLDMTDKKKQYVKKYDKHTGKLLWTSSEIKGARAIPGMKVVGDKVALQIGGRVEVQYFRQYKSGDYIVSEWGRTFPEVKPFGVQAFNTGDGSLAWESEKFKKGITNAISFDKYHIVCSGKALYSIDINTGEQKYEVPVSKGGVGQASLILKYKEDVIVVIGEKGISTFSAANGDLICSGKYKSSSLEERIDDIVVMKTDKADIAAFDLNTCSYKEFKARKGAGTSLTSDGKHVFVYEKNNVTKVKTR